MLDTHAWVWWASDAKALSAKARTLIGRARTIGVCAISLWEVAMLVERGRLELDRPVSDWLEQAVTLVGVELLAMTPDVAVRSARLPREPLTDPADRMIVASALAHEAVLVSRDMRIRASGLVECVW